MTCRKEGGSFLLFKIRLRVIHKKRKREKKREEKGRRRRKKERKKRSQVCKLWVYGTCYVPYGKVSIFLYNSMDLSSFGYRKNRYMVWNPLSCV